MTVENEDIKTESTPAEIAPDVENDARQKGWIPKERYKGNPDDWRSPQQYLDTLDKRKLLKEVTAQRERYDRTVSDLNAKIDNLSKLMQGTVVQSTKQGFDKITAERKSAIIAGDVERVEKLDQQLFDYKLQMANLEREQPKPNIPHPQNEQEIIDQFISEDDSWLAAPEARAFAERKDNELRSKFPNLPVRERLSMVKEMTSILLKSNPAPEQFKAQYIEPGRNTNRPMGDNSLPEFDQLPRKLQENIELFEAAYRKGEIPKDFRKNYIKSYKELGLI